MNFATYIRKLEAALAFAIRILAPGPLGHLDRWLLLNQPWLWRTGIIPMLGLAGWLAAGCYAFGRSSPISSKTMPTITEVSTVWSIMLLIGLIILGLWVVAQIRWPLPTMSASQLVYTALVYTFIVFCLLIPPAVYSIPVTIRMAQAVPDEIFDAEYALHEAQDFWVCTTAIEEEPAGDLRERLVQSLERYGFLNTFKYVPADFESPVSRALCSTSVGWPPTLLFALDGEAYASDAEFGRFSRLFGERLKAVRAAKSAVSSDTGELEGITTGSVAPTTTWSLIAALLLLVFCPLSRFSIGASFLAAVWNSLLIRRPRNDFALGRSVFFKPSHHPTLYALAPIHILISHVVLVTMFVAISSSRMFGDTPDEVLTRLTQGLTDFFAFCLALLLPAGILVCHFRILQDSIAMNNKLVSSQIIIYLASTLPTLTGYAWLATTYDLSPPDELRLTVMIMLLGGFAASCLYSGLITLYRIGAVVFLIGGAISIGFYLLVRWAWGLTLIPGILMVFFWGGVGRYMPVGPQMWMGYLVYTVGAGGSGFWLFVLFLNSLFLRGEYVHDGIVGDIWEDSVVTWAPLVLWGCLLALLLSLRGRVVKLFGMSRRPGKY